MAEGLDMNFDLRDWLPDMPQPQVPQAPAPIAPPPPVPTPGAGPGAGVLPPGYGNNPQDLMRQIMQMMLSQSLGNFFNPNARGPSSFTPGPSTGFAPPAPPGVPGPFPISGGPMMPAPIGGPTQPMSPMQGPLQPGSNPNLAYASGGGGGGTMGAMLNPGDTSYLAPSANWDMRGRMGTMIPEMQGPQGSMNGMYSFISELLRQMAQGGWPTAGAGGPANA